MDHDDYAELSVLHGVPGLTVDVYVDGELTLDDFEPAALAGPLALALGGFAGIGVRGPSWPELLAETLGEHVFDFFLRNKRAEWEEYRTQVSAYERDRMLPVL